MLFEYLTDNFDRTDVIFFVNNYLREAYNVYYELTESLEEFYGEKAFDLVIALGRGYDLQKEFFIRDNYGWIHFLSEYEVIEDMKQHENVLLEAIEDENEYIIEGLYWYLDITIEELKKGLKEYDN